MFSASILTKVLVQIFEQEVGKWQDKKTPGDRKALLVSFSLRNHENEEGHRELDLLVYGPTNYVGVYARECWSVISLDDLEPSGDEDGEMVISPGKDYTVGQEPWRRVAYHDSGWRTDGINDVLQEYAAKITGFRSTTPYVDRGTGMKNGCSFYQVVDVPPKVEAMS